MTSVLFVCLGNICRSPAAEGVFRKRAAEAGLDVAIDSAGTGGWHEGALPDPRHEAMGWRRYGSEDVSQDVDWTAVRVANGIPATGIELTPDSYILEADFERLNGVNFKKGCFVGQEIVARMKHKTTLNKGIVRVSIDGAAEEGSDITQDGKPAGTLHSIAGGEGLAFLRFSRAEGELKAGEATLTRIQD